MKGWQQISVESWLWLIFALYWFIASRTTAKTKARESLLSSLPRNALLALAGALVFCPRALCRRAGPALCSLFAGASA